MTIFQGFVIPIRRSEGFSSLRLLVELSLGWPHTTSRLLHFTVFWLRHPGSVFLLSHSGGIAYEAVPAEYNGHKTYGLRANLECMYIEIFQQFYP